MLLPELAGKPFYAARSTFGLKVAQQQRQYTLHVSDPPDACHPQATPVDLSGATPVATPDRACSVARWRVTHHSVTNAGKVVLVLRGSCNYTDKASTLAETNAAGMLVYNSQPGGRVSVCVCYPALRIKFSSQPISGTRPCQLQAPPTRSPQCQRRTTCSLCVQSQDKPAPALHISHCCMPIPSTGGPGTASTDASPAAQAASSLVARTLWAMPSRCLPSACRRTRASCFSMQLRQATSLHQTHLPTHCHKMFLTGCLTTTHCNSESLS